MNNKGFCINRNRLYVPGAGFVPFPCQNGGMGVEVASKLVPPFFISSEVEGQAVYVSKEMVDDILPQKDLNVWACLLGKIGEFLKTLEAYCLVTNWVPRGLSLTMPCQVLWSVMLEMGNAGQRQMRFVPCQMGGRRGA
jgi:hypothetical protein